jgi:hypothetical protein
LEFNASGLDIGLIQPKLISYNNFSENALSLEIEPTLQIVSFSKNF